MDEINGHENYMSRKQIDCAELAAIRQHVVMQLRMSGGGLRGRWERLRGENEHKKA
jgi:hypothetical protein